MKNKLLSISLLTLLLTVTMLLGFASKVSADALAVGDFQRDGAQTFYSSIPLYAQDDYGFLVNDPTTPSGFAYNSFDLTINSTSVIPTEFNYPVVLSDASGCDWSFKNESWSLRLPSGSNLVRFNGCELNDYNSYFDSTAYPLHKVVLIYNTIGVGTFTMRVTSPGIIGDDSDSTAYTVSVTVFDNSPPPPKPKASPTPSGN